MDYDNPITDYWMRYYLSKNMCSLCGQSGKIDTTGKTTPAGVHVGRINYCICPNGQARRCAEEGDAKINNTIQERLERAEQTVAFVARWAWRTDPPNATGSMSDSDRLSCIKHHPVIKKAAAPHIELAEQEARALQNKEQANG